MLRQSLSISMTFLIKISNTLKCQFLLAVMLTCFSCTDKRGNVQTVCEIPDSTMMNVTGNVVHVIHVGDKITNMPLCSQIVVIDGREKYMMLDEANIYMYDWETGNLEDSIPTKGCGTLGNYSGFTYLSNDSIVVFNSTEETLFLINAKGQIVKNVRIRSNSEDLTKSVSTVSGLNACRLDFHGVKPVVSGFILGCMKEAKEIGRIPVSEEIDLNDGSCKPVVTYPDVYMEENWATVYMNNVYTACDRQGNTTYSFPILNKVLRYNSDFTKCDTFIMQSRYERGIKPCDKSQDEIEADERIEKEYYVSQLTYANIVFDSYRDLYIRVVEHPLAGWKVKEKFVKPKSFIISDCDGNVLSETPIVKDSKKMIASNMHICRKGLVIAVDNPDENNIYFRCFEIKK